MDSQPPVKIAMLPPTDSKVWQTQLSFLSSLIVTLGILAYCAGYVVVNSYLSKYGIAPYDLLQPNYVSAGLLYLLSTVGFTSLMVFAHFQARNRREVLVTAWFDTALAIFIFFFIIRDSLDMAGTKRIARMVPDSRYKRFRVRLCSNLLSSTGLPISLDAKIFRQRSRCIPCATSNDNLHIIQNGL